MCINKGAPGPPFTERGSLCLLCEVGLTMKHESGRKLCSVSGYHSRYGLLKRERRCRMDPVPLLLVLLTSWPLSSAVYDGPLQPEISNGTFHHFFVPEGDYEETVDPEQCQMLFKFSDVVPCAAAEESDVAVRDDFIITKLQAEDAARMLEGIGRAVAHDLEEEESYGKFLQKEISQIGEAFSSVDKSLVELEVKFKQSQETELREEEQLNGYVMKQVSDIRGALRETTDISQGLRDRHELLSLIIRSHSTRLSRLKTEFLNVGL